MVLIVVMMCGEGEIVVSDDDILPYNELNQYYSGDDDGDYGDKVMVVGIVMSLR